MAGMMLSILIQELLAPGEITYLLRGIRAFTVEWLNSRLGNDPNQPYFRLIIPSSKCIWLPFSCTSFAKRFSATDRRGTTLCFLFRVGISFSS